MKKNSGFAIKILWIFIGLFLVQGKIYSQEKYLVVLDIQELFIKNKPYEENAKTMIANANNLIRRFDKDRVIYIKSTGKTLVISSKGFSTDTMPTPGFDSRLTIVNNHIFTKVKTGDAFDCAEFVNFLDGKTNKDIVLVGLLAEECITRTALGGKKRGYNMYLVPEAVTGKSEKSKEKSIGKLKKEGIKFLPLEELIIKP